MKSNPDELEQKIEAALLELHERKEWKSNKQWTRAVKNAVGRVVRGPGRRVWAAQSEFRAGGEWLLDLCCFKESKDHRLIFKMLLAMESEWNPKADWEDFQKLVVTRADLRLFVTWDKKSEKWNARKAKLIEIVERFEGTRKGDRYLFCCWIDDFESPPIIEPFVAKRSGLPERSRIASVDSRSSNGRKAGTQLHP